MRKLESISLKSSLLMHHALLLSRLIAFKLLYIYIQIRMLADPVAEFTKVSVSLRHFAGKL